MITRIFPMALILVTSLVQGQVTGGPKAGRVSNKVLHIFHDTLHHIVTDSFSNDLGNIPMVNSQMVKYFKYTGKRPIKIIRTWTGDPHYICDYPKGLLHPRKTYSFTVCFYHFNHPGVFNTDMGFILSDGENITFRFRGYVQFKQ
jgi:hypothetical protein